MLYRVVSLDGIKIHTRFWDQGISIGGAWGRLQAWGRVLKPISTALQTIARDHSGQGPPNAVCECSVPDRLRVRANAQNETRYIRQAALGLLLLNSNYTPLLHDFR